MKEKPQIARDLKQIRESLEKILQLQVLLLKKVLSSDDDGDDDDSGGGNFPTHLKDFSSGGDLNDSDEDFFYRGYIT